MNKKTLGAIAVITAAIMWSFDGVFLLPEIREIDVNLIVFIQHLFPFLIMCLAFTPFYKTIVGDVKVLKTVDWVAFLAVAFFGGYLGTYAIVQAFFHVFAEGANITMVLLLQKLQPVFAILMAIVFLREKPTKNYWLWAGLALIGSYILTFGFDKPDWSLENKTLVAALFAGLAAFSWGSSTVFSKKALGKVSFTTGTFLRFGLTTIISFFIVALFSGFGDFSDITGKQWCVFLIIAITTGGGAIWLYYWGLKRVRASASTIYELALPFSGILFEYFYHDHLMSNAQFFGAGVLLVAILAMVKDKNKYAGTSLSGKVKKGLGEGSKFVKIYNDKMEKEFGFVSFEGTLNVEVGKDFKIPELAKKQFIDSFKKDGKSYGKLFYIRGEINDYDCVVVFPEKTQHKDSILEVVSPYNLREKLGLDDGQVVNINYVA